MPFVDVKIVGKLSRKQKQEITKKITELLKDVAGKDPKYTYVVIEEVERENWAIAGELLG
jgi:4-oxalocrotonate tautomerase